MRRAPIALALLGCVLAACATPEVAKDYKTTRLLPQEIEDALRSEDPARRSDAASQLETMPPVRRQAVLAALATDDRAHVRLLAVSLLGTHHADDPQTLTVLADVLSLDADLDVRSAAVAALAGSRNPKTLAILVGVLTDDVSLLVKRDAAEALDRRTGQPFGLGLVEGLDAAEEAADGAMMLYEEWFESRAGSIRWDEEQGRFVEKDG